MLYVHSQPGKSFCFVQYITVCFRCILFSYFRGNHRGKCLVYSTWGFVAHSSSCCQRQMELRDSFLACSICFYISCYFAPQPMEGENPQITVLPSYTFTLYPRHGASWRWDRASYGSSFKYSTRQSLETLLSCKKSSSSWVPVSPGIPSWHHSVFPRVTWSRYSLMEFITDIKSTVWDRNKYSQVYWLELIT